MTQAHQPETEEPTQGEPSSTWTCTRTSRTSAFRGLRGGDTAGRAKGLGAIVVNGLEPVSNRQILDMAKRHPVCRAALGIYPVDAVVSLLPEDFPFHVATFDVDAEIGFIKTQAEQGLIAAVAWASTATGSKPPPMPSKSGCFVRSPASPRPQISPSSCIAAKKSCAASSSLRSFRWKKSTCTASAESRLGAKYAEEQGWCFSIPANVQTNEGFQALVRRLPPGAFSPKPTLPFSQPRRKN